MIFLSELKIRNMEIKDIDIVYKHIHQSFVNKYFENEKLQREIHNKRYESIIHSKNCIFHIFEDNSDNFIAFVSHKIRNCSSEISIYLNKEFRQKNFSKKILKMSMEKLLETKKEIKELKAFILEENIISRKVFLDLGFEYIDIKNYENVDYQIFKKNV